MNKAIANALFKDQVLEHYLQTASEDSVRRLFSLINDVRDLNPNLKEDVRTLVKGRFPHLVAASEPTPVAVSSRKGLLATLRMFNAKKKELQHILDVEVPKNAKEIGTAMALGDLKENADYHDAKEEQGFVEARIRQLEIMLGRAKLIEQNGPSDIVRVGCTVTVAEEGTDDMETYTIVGAHEADPTKGLISNESPIGSAMLGAKKGQTIRAMTPAGAISLVIHDIS